jgi:hypothetical protein
VLETLQAYDAFISFSSSDGGLYAANLQHLLQERGWRCFSAAGDAGSRTLSTALRGSELFVLVASPSTSSSSIILAELQEFRRTRRPIISITFDDITIDSAIWAPQAQATMWIKESAAALKNGDLTNLNPVIDSLNNVLLPKLRVAPLLWFTSVAISMMVSLLVMIIGSFLASFLSHYVAVFGFAGSAGVCTAAALILHDRWQKRRWKPQFVSASVRNAIAEFYSCFVSYSTRDQVFCDRLYVNLQEHRVRCWYAPKDLKTGDRFRQEIEDAISLHDKLLVILSEHSVNSDWVQEEVESCFERERRQERNILFPIRIDNAILDTNRAWVAAIRRQRQIGDFTGWKDPTTFRDSFNKLLRDLSK